MATERRRRLRALALLPVLLMLALAAPAHAAQAWWQPLAFTGQRVDSVRTEPGRLLVHVAAGYRVSTDGGRTFRPIGAATPAAPALVSGGVAWDIRDGVMLTGPSAATLHPDPGAPFLGTSAHLLAAPAAAPGVVVAVGSDNHVWRRAPTGGWATSFILLPAGGVSPAPQVTALAAFTTPLSRAVYMGTDGYGVLLTQDGGDDWIRADPGLPENVLGLATDEPTRSLYAATDQGLLVHQLQAIPAPPVYHDSALLLRWLGIAIVALISAALAVVALARLVRSTAPPAPS